jgi:hypothetical protein
MDNTITYDEVTALVGVNILTLEPHPNFASRDSYNASHAPKASNMDGKEW